jgi:hypothetical protein
MREDRLSVLILRVFSAIVLLGVTFGLLRATSSPTGAVRRERCRMSSTCREVSSVTQFPDQTGTSRVFEVPPYDEDEVGKVRSNPEYPSPLIALPCSPSSTRLPENPRLARTGLLRC